ncbi:hypothetical protein [Demequina litorisediminis]|uniref:hypothetical protein n=1 Tax=Demequina litorisediminis TaxID=1849022 RepID=UPI0024E13F19|nr:hypothetical protein [Demequina litorisediminis]
MSAGTMYVFIFVTAKVRPGEAGDLTARAFVLAELVASLEWQAPRVLLWCRRDPDPANHHDAGHLRAGVHRGTRRGTPPLPPRSPAACRRPHPHLRSRGGGRDLPHVEPVVRHDADPVLRPPGPRGVLHPHPRRPVRFCHPVRPARPTAGACTAPKRSRRCR